MNCFFYACNLNWYKIWYRYLSILWLSYFECSCTFLVIKIKYLFVIYFKKRDWYFAVLSALNCFHYHLQWSRKNSSLLTWEKMVDILFIIFNWRIPTDVRRGWIIADYGVCLTRPCLTVCKYCDVGSIQELIDWLLQKIENIFLSRVIWQNVTKLHVSVVSWSLNLQRIVVLKLNELCLLLFIENRSNSNNYF